MKKIKYYVRKNLISFVIGLILFGSLGAYAIVTFQSKDVSYENEASGLASKNVQGAIDELYTECTKVPAPGDTILDSVDIVTSGDGLYEDTYEEGRYFYKGKNVNNYITFNNEAWRIVSIEPDKTIKIMKDTSIGNRAWDSSDSNNWKRPADLNTYLNGSYLTGTLNQAAQSQIVPKDWSIGSVTNDNNDLADQINDEKSTTWVKIMIMIVHVKIVAGCISMIIGGRCRLVPVALTACSSCIRTAASTTTTLAIRTMRSVRPSIYRLVSKSPEETEVHQAHILYLVLDRFR